MAKYTPNTKNRITIQVGGSDEDEGLVRLPEFLDILSSFHEVLSRLDKMLTRSSAPSLYFRITRLSYSSPAFVETEILPLKPTALHAPAVIDKYFTGLESIRLGKIPDEFDRQILESYKRINHGARRRVRDVVFTSDSLSSDMTIDIEPQINKALGGEESIYGDLTGILEVINIHAGANKFIIYPIVGADKVECYFPDGEKDKAIQAVGKRVLVRGEMKYRSREKHPHQMRVQAIEVYPPDEELADIMELQGLAPDATGSLSSEEFIRRIRSNE